VVLVALLSAKWALLVTPKCLGPHFLIDVSYQLIFLKRVLMFYIRVKMDLNLANQALDEAIDIRDALVLYIFLQYASIRLREIYPYVIM
jgi:hypothetical protein